MEIITANGIDWVIAIQSLGGWLEPPMRLLTYLGSEDFFFIVLPLVYWSIDSRIGLQIALVLSTSSILNSIFKLAFASPRPYWVSEQVRAYAAESSFGIPSGHAQYAVAIWSVMANGVRRRWAWIAALVLMLLIGASRVYLGVHFVQDVIAGWLIGAVILGVFMGLWNPVADWLSGKTPALQILLAFLVSLIAVVLGAWMVGRLDGYILPQEWIDNALRAGAEPDPVTMEGILTPAGSFFGLAAGAAWIASRGGYQASGPVEKRALRYVVGLIGVLILWMGLGEVFPRDQNLLSYALRYIRYALVGFWVTAGAPWLFFHFKLAGRPKM
jgi:membrane-associated phospholipid phosphatase